MGYAHQLPPAHTASLDTTCRITFACQPALRDITSLLLLELALSPALHNSIPSCPNTSACPAYLPASPAPHQLPAFPALLGPNYTYLPVSPPAPLNTTPPPRSVSHAGIPVVVVQVDLRYALVAVWAT